MVNILIFFCLELVLGSMLVARRLNMIAQYFVLVASEEE